MKLNKKARLPKKTNPLTTFRKNKNHPAASANIIVRYSFCVIYD